MPAKWEQKTKDMYELNGNNVMADIFLESGLYVLDVMMLPGLTIPVQYPLNTTNTKTAKKRATELMIEYLKTHAEKTQSAINDIFDALSEEEPKK